MALPITIPNTFAGSTTAIPLSQLDNNFTTVVNGINGIGNGTNSLANVSITGGSIANVTLTGTVTAPTNGYRRNKIINGNFDFWQRATSFSNPASGAYTSDRWTLEYNGTGASRTLSRQTFTLGQTDVPANPSYFFRFDQTGAGSGAAFNVLEQRIEGVSTFAGQTITLTFYAKAAASLTIPSVRLRQNFGTGGSPSATVDNTVTTSLAITTSFTKYTLAVTLPSISGKTLGTNGDDSLILDFYLPLNTTFTFDLAQVQLEAGSVATPFEQRFLGTELALCQRYYQAGSVLAFVTAWPTTTIMYPLKVTMRAIPTVNLSNFSAGSGGAYAALDANSIYQTVGNSTQAQAIMTASAEL